MCVRSNWTYQELEELYNLPLYELLIKAMNIHSSFHEVGKIQLCHLISIKTGGCSEDCKYCAQSSYNKTSVKALPMMKYESVIAEAQRAKSYGATRVCLGAAWRNVRNSKQFKETIKMVKGIAELGLEVCCTLGMLDDKQAQELKGAGLYAYNHNLDSSERFYKTIITTRSYQDRLETLDVVQKAGISVCCGGILGMGESTQDRLELLLNLAKRDPHPDSVPINQLERIAGTPLQDCAKFSFWEFLKGIAIARIVMPKAMIRLSAGRSKMSHQEQLLCFLVGANSIFTGEKLLTVANAPLCSDEEMFEKLGLKIQEPYESKRT